MTIREALLWAISKLKKSNSPQLDAEVLLSFILHKDKSYLFTYPEKKLTAHQIKKFINLTKQRVNNYPIAYLTSYKEFYGLNFYVDKRVLIPRPETEILVEQARLLINKYKLKTLADIGTGSGCLAISLKKLFPRLKVYASDIDLRAIQVAKKNAHLNKVPITFKIGDLLTPYKQQPIDIFLANLPYLSQKVYYQAHTIKHEPKTALFAKKNGLYYIEAIIQSLNKLKYKPQYLLLEIDPKQIKKISTLIKQKGYLLTRNNKGSLTIKIK